MNRRPDRSLRIATWNLEWAKPGTPRHSRCIEQLDQVDADIVITTEHSVFDWDRYPHRIDAGPDWGYPLVEGRRKVIAWSKEPWTNTTPAPTGAAAGRWIAGTTGAHGRPVDVLAVCIPWREAHVRTGRRDAQPWSEHLEFVEHLAAHIRTRTEDRPLVIAGDFNQRFPQRRQPVAVHDALVGALGPLRILTAGDHGDVGRLIDHIASSPEVVAESVVAWPNTIDGSRLSDHAGVAIDLAL